MKKTSFIVFALLFSAFCGISYKYLHACIGGDWTFEYQSIYTPETAGLDTTLSPMFYETATSFNDSYSSSEWKEDQAMLEWNEFFKGEIPDEAIRFYLFATEGEKEFLSILRNGTASTSFPHLNWETPKMIEFKNFLRLALEVDKAADGRNYSWNYQPQKEVFTGELFVEEIVQKYRETTDDIMKLKWWFQAVKAKYYSSNKKSLISFLSETGANVPKGTSYFRALSYLGGVYHQEGNFPMANVQYAKVMAHCAPLRFEAVFSYHALNENDFDFTLGLLSDPEEKAALWAMQGYYTNELDAMLAIYALTPNSELLDIMLTRSLNKMEVALSNTSRDNYKEYIADVKQSISPELPALINKINAEGKVRDKEMWNIAAAYVNALTGENEMAEQELEKVLQRGSAQEKDQAKVLSVVNEIMRLGHEDDDLMVLSDSKKTRAFEQRIYPYLNWLYSQGSVEVYKSYSHWDTENKKTKVRVQYAYEWSRRILGLLYKDDIRGELVEPNEKYYQDPQKLSAMKNFLSEEHGAYDNLLIKNYPVSMDDIELYEGVVLVLTGQLEKAKEHFLKTKLANEKLLADPFVTGIQDCHDCEHSSYRGKKWSRMSTLNRMIQLQKNLIRNKDKYNSALALGNAYYNLSLFGNARLFYEVKLMYSWGLYLDEFNEDKIYSNSNAKDYYRIAMQSAQSDEQRAKCEYFIAKCDRNSFYTKGWVNNGVDFLAWDGFFNLKSKYSNTQFYNDVVRECGYFRTYLSKN